MVRPRSLRWKLGCVATGFTMDGTFFLHGPLPGGPASCREHWLALQAELLKDAIHDVARAERESTVDQYGAQLVLGDIGLERQERPKLRVAILFDHEADLVFREERFHGVIEGKTADAHEIANGSQF